MRECTERLRKSVLFAAAAASIGYTLGASATTTFYAYDATTFAIAPDPTSADGGSWQNVIGGTQSLIGFGAGSGSDGNYWQISDSVTNGSKGYGIASPAPPASTFTEPNGWTATLVAKVLTASAPKLVPFSGTAGQPNNNPDDSIGLYPAPSFVDVRGGGKLATMGQVNSGADESYFRAANGSQNTITLQDMDVHSYFNTYQMVYTPAVFDNDGVLISPDSLREYVNGKIMSDTTVAGTSGVVRIQFFSGSQAALQLVQYQKFLFESGNTVVSQPTPGVWTAGGGTFSDTANWTDGLVPTGLNSTAKFGSTGGASTINFSAPTSLGLLELDSSNPYTLAGTGTLNMVFSSRGAGAIDVKSGQHTVFAPLTFDRAAMFTILDPTASLSIQGPIDTIGKDIRKAGPGAVDMAVVRANALKVSGGTLTIRPNGTTTGVCKVTSLDISYNNGTIQTNSNPVTGKTGQFKAIATLELNNNPIIIDYTGTSPTTTLRQSLKSAYNGGSWDGTGLTSSVVKANAADINNPIKAALIYGEASAIGVTLVGDQTLDSSSLLVRIGLSADANADGKVNALDFNALAANFGTATNKVWAQGDFNYDGTVNSIDFTALSTNYSQTFTFSPGSALGTLLPEPASMAMLLLIGTSVAGRRRRVVCAIENGRL